MMQRAKKNLCKVLKRRYVRTWGWSSLFLLNRLAIFGLKCLSYAHQNKLVCILLHSKHNSQLLLQIETELVFSIKPTPSASLAETLSSKSCFELLMESDLETALVHYSLLIRIKFHWHLMTWFFSSNRCAVINDLVGFTCNNNGAVLAAKKQCKAQQHPNSKRRGVRRPRTVWRG